MRDWNQLWEHETRIADREDVVEVPSWIDPDITWSTVAAIYQGGCASGAYMPAVTYHEAVSTMAIYGDDVLDYLQENDFEADAKKLMDESWSGIACYFLSAAVETWAREITGRYGAGEIGPE